MGTAIPITITFSELVTVTGTPQLALNAGSNAGHLHRRERHFDAHLHLHRGGGPKHFRPGYASTTALTLNGGTIHDASGHPALLTLPTTGTDGLAMKNIMIDTTPTVSVTDASGTYNGSAFLAMATVAGVGGAGQQSGRRQPDVAVLHRQ